MKQEFDKEGKRSCEGMQMSSTSLALHSSNKLLCQDLSVEYFTNLTALFFDKKYSMLAFFSIIHSTCE